MVAIVFGVGWNPPHDTVHKFSTDSNYKPQQESGCTNSGAGCHGAETSYKDFNKYHPNVPCSKCHAYQGIACIPCHAPNSNHECPLCHDGSMKIAPDVVRITDNYPHGHYRETTHTAMGDDYDTAIKAPTTSQLTNADSTGAQSTAQDQATTQDQTTASTDPQPAPEGMARATCADCHPRDLRTAHAGVAQIAGSPYGSDIGCGECHNDVRAHGQAEVIAKWKSRQCEACHKVGSSAPMHAVNRTPITPAVGSAGCASTGSGCHDTDDLHAIHADRPNSCSGSAKKGEPGCHKLDGKATKPLAKTCGGTGAQSCHRAGSGGTFVHKNVDNVHSPSNNVPASVVFVDGVTCGECHLMAPNGTSLLDDHEGSTSSTASSSGDSCISCHSSPASADAIDDKWAASGSADACQACHGHAGLAGVHDTDVSDAHTVSGSAGCASSGAGCHPTSDISSVGQPTTSSGVHASCLRCHAISASGGNGTYDPSKKTCGSGRDCHSSASFNPATSSHKGAGSGDTKHTAGASQRDATYVDLATGLATPCGSCHKMNLGGEHARPNNALAGFENPCTGCHNAEGSPEVVKGEWPNRTNSKACSACHATSGSNGMHSGIGTAHVATELGPDGTPTPGSCVRYGCHGSLDLRVLHAGNGCATTGCHSASGDEFGRNITSCGGGNEFTACHTGFTADEHFTSHNGNQSGTVHGIKYGTATNIGCFGCHASDLVKEHSRELAAGTLTGTPANGCRVCHYDPTDPGSGPLTQATKVRQAIDKRDLRCATCHSSGTASSTDEAIASAHKKTSAHTPLPVGKVWSDPFDDWKTALDAPTGGGHNALSASIVGATGDKRFPMTDFIIDGQPYTWSLPRNSGSTTWIKASAFGMTSIDTTEEIRDLQVQCSDCHAMPSDMTGPHGSAIHVGIDPDYSQTEYSDPARDESQFTATGDDRVVCMKCHNMEASTNPVVDPGGNPVHARHVAHSDLPSSNPHHYGEACIDCHVRIPHAWRRPRMLVRTVETTDGAVPDVYPYIPNGYDGLAGVVLRSFTSTTDLRSRYCATNGCHGGHSPTRHPLPSEIPTATYWP